MANFDLPYQNPRYSAPPRCGWEQMLANMEITENDCTSHLVTQTRKDRAIRSWTLTHYSTNYVPEWLLQMLGVHRRLSRIWRDLD
jgi:hypothetical protein